MASEAAQIGSNDNYTGDKNLGGGDAGVYNIDVKPLENLATYTMMFQKSKWEQQQKETDAKVAQLADLSNISLNDLKGKDKEQATKEFADLQKYAAEYAIKTPKNAQERIQNELDWQTKYGAFKNNFSSGKQRAVSYYKQLNEANQNITDAAERDVVIKDLNKRFDETGIDTQISAVPNFKAQHFDLPKPSIQSVDTISILGNDTVNTKGGVFTAKANIPLADAVIMDIKKSFPKKDTTEYKNLSQSEKLNADRQATVESTASGWADAASLLNPELQKYVANGVFDEDAF